MAININIRIGGKKRRQAPKPATTKTGQDKSLRTSKRLFLAVLLMAVAVITGIWLWHSKPWQQSPTIPRRISEEVSFPVYSPTKLPAGFKIAEDSFSAKPKVVTFAITYDTSKKILVSQQVVPTGFDFNDFHTKKIEGGKEVLGESGKVVTGVLNNYPVASLVTEKTWVLITAPDGLPADQLTEIAKTFKSN